jgi:hypothetical protein
MNAVGRNIPLFMDDRSVVTLHLSVGLESVGPDLSQRLGEVFSLLDYWFEISTVIDAELTTNHANRVAARRDERQLITVTPSPA